jgi:hypothetical protein
MNVGDTFTHKGVTYTVKSLDGEYIKGIANSSIDIGEAPDMASGEAVSKTNPSKIRNAPRIIRIKESDITSA